MRIALVGQPNSGKSTLFNSVAGYRSIAANFPGSTVHYAVSQTRIQGMQVEIVDLPGTYSLTASSPAESATRHYLLEEEVDVVIHVADASLLQRSLELTIQLVEFQVPLVLCLNMMDDSARKGIRIDTQHLSNLLGIPVAVTVARKGEGVAGLFDLVFQAARERKIPVDPLRGHKDIEDVFAALTRQLTGKERYPFSQRSLAIKLLEGDESFYRFAALEDHELVCRLRKQLEESHGRPAVAIIEAERHALAMELAERVTEIGRPRRDIRDRLDDVLMHPVWGYGSLFLIMFLFFIGIFKLGAVIEGALLDQFQHIQSGLLELFPPDSTLAVMIGGFLQGIAGGIVIVLPYLIPFLFGLAVLEDIGYLPRVAFLVDTLMHRAGLHGTAILPVIMGYGCSVPAVMATRILQSPRDRIIAAVISILVPCSARTTVILALVGFYMGGAWAFALYVFNIVVVIASGRILSSLMPQLTPGMILEVPRYQWPVLHLLLRKTWFRMREFVRVAWPLLIAGSTLLALAQHFRATDIVNTALSPLTVSVLGLPAVVGTTLIFGVLRKELSLLMLITALGSTQLNSVLTAQQMLVFTVFVMFYIPCVATIGVLVREMGTKISLYATAYTFVIALLASGLLRLVFLGL